MLDGPSASKQLSRLYQLVWLQTGRQKRYGMMAETCRLISAPQLDRARNVQFRHFLIDSERRKVDLIVEVSGVSNERNVVQLIHVVQSDDV